MKFATERRRFEKARRNGMIYNQTSITKIPKKTIHLDLYVDESKNRIYTDFDGNTEKITYIMIL